MSKSNLPAYAIVELLMRLSSYNKKIGDYRGHMLRNGYVFVKTTGGSLRFTTEMILQQFENPDLVSHETLAQTAALFKPPRVNKLFWTYPVTFI